MFLGTRASQEFLFRMEGPATKTRRGGAFQVVDIKVRTCLCHKLQCVSKNEAKVGENLCGGSACTLFGTQNCPLQKKKKDRLRVFLALKGDSRKLKLHLV